MNWLKNLYAKFAFQQRYDAIKAWKLNADVDRLFEEVWNKIAPSIQTAIWNFLKVMYEKYGEEAAKELLRRILDSIKSKGYIIS